MIKGIGIDIVEIDRIKNSIKKNTRFINRILTDKEKEIYTSIKTEVRKLEFVAGRFAAKEAYAKANGTGIGKLSFKDIEVSNDDQGAPKIFVSEQQDQHVFVSISHSEAYAVAQVVIESSR
ncbi:holo-ACP synthase [Aquibacillus sediminis]|uniref:holo-ACP synthase n=1 Tax=Aquibacillus sediminis TaxID=2574734 RepID=UPI001107BC1A|nr:holo-ACP synthase [Aquibacillus sediminis]